MLGKWQPKLRIITYHSINSQLHEAPILHSQYVSVFV